MHPIELYQRYLNAYNNHSIPNYEFYPKFCFFSQRMYSEQREWRFVGLTMLVNDPLSGNAVLSPETMQESEKVKQLLTIGADQFSCKFFYVSNENFDESEPPNIDDNCCVIEGLGFDDAILNSVLEKIAAIDVIQRANEALAQQGVYIEILGVPYFLSSGEDYEDSCSIELYEAIDPNGVSYWLCETSLMFIATEKGDDEYTMLLQPAVLEKFVFGENQQEQCLDEKN